MTVGCKVSLTLRFCSLTIVLFWCPGALWDCSVLQMLYWHTLIITWHFHDVSGNDLSGFNPLYALSVSAVHFSHLGLVFLQSLDGTLRIALLWKQMSTSVSVPHRTLHLVDPLLQWVCILSKWLPSRGPSVKHDRLLVFLLTGRMTTYNCALRLLRPVGVKPLTSDVISTALVWVLL